MDVHIDMSAATASLNNKVLYMFSFRKKRSLVVLYPSLDEATVYSAGGYGSSDRNAQGGENTDLAN